MATYTFTGHTLSLNGGNINVTSSTTFSIVLTDDDGRIGDPGDTGELISINGGTPQNYTFQGAGVTDVGESMIVIELADGSLIGFNTAGGELQNGNTKVSLADLVADPTVPCFTPGSLILTPDGEVRVEDLQPGDLVSTRDNGARPVVKVLKRHVSGADLTSNLRPVRIEKDAFGPGLPTELLVVSPQHRFSITDWRAELLFAESEVLVSAKSLVDGHAITVDETVLEVTYVHLVLDKHEIIAANGVATETVLMSDDFLKNVPLAARIELEQLFGTFVDANQASVAPILKHFEGAVLSQ